MRGVGLAAFVLAGLLSVCGADAQPWPFGGSGRPAIRDMQNRSAEIARNYLATWSANGEAVVAGVPELYGPKVRFYGRNMSYSALQAEKRRALRRWPTRSYTIRPGTMDVVCNEDTMKCAVRAVVDYRVADRRGREASGATTFDLGISFAGPRPVVLYENGRVLRRHG
jgi:hypothetical protein